MYQLTDREASIARKAVRQEFRHRWRSRRNLKKKFGSETDTSRADSNLKELEETYIALGGQTENLYQTKEPTTT